MADAPLSHARPIRVLFVCVENSCRSQMAEAFTRMDGGDDVEAHSAGSRPSGTVNPGAIRSMAELGYDLSSHRSKHPGGLASGPWDAVVTMGCGDECPVVDTARREDWPVPDPKAMDADGFRAVRDEIRGRVRTLLASLLPRANGLR